MSTDLAAELAKYKFYHCIDLGNGVTTPGWKEIEPVQAPVSAEIARHDLNGKRVLDIGCRDGLFSFQAERQGAASVLGIDSALSLGAVELLIPWFKSKVEMQEANINDFVVEPDERFDFVIFAGVLYHLRTPFLALKRIADAMKPGGTMVLETALMLSHYKHPFLYCPSPEDKPVDKTSISYFNHLALVAALGSFGFAEIECHSIVLTMPGCPSYDGWMAFLEGPHKHLAERQEVIIGRGTYTCRFANADGGLSGYWFGTRKPPAASHNWSALGGQATRIMTGPQEPEGGPGANKPRSAGAA